MFAFFGTEAYVPLAASLSPEGAAAVSGTFVLAEAAGGFVAAIVGGVVIGWLVGRAASELVRRLDLRKQAAIYERLVAAWAVALARGHDDAHPHAYEVLFRTPIDRGDHVVRIAWPGEQIAAAGRRQLLVAFEVLAH